jgi:hypothetical protein
MNLLKDVKRAPVTWRRLILPVNPRQFACVLHDYQWFVIPTISKLARIPPSYQDQWMGVRLISSGMIYPQWNIGREFGAEAEISHNTTSGLGSTVASVTYRRRGLWFRNLHAVLPIGAAGSGRGKLGGQLRRVQLDRIDSYASHGDGRVGIRHSLQLFIWDCRDIGD